MLRTTGRPERTVRLARHEPPPLVPFVQTRCRRVFLAHLFPLDSPDHDGTLPRPLSRRCPKPTRTAPQSTAPEDDLAGPTRPPPGGTRPGGHERLPLRRAQKRSPTASGARDEIGRYNGDSASANLAHTAPDGWQRRTRSLRPYRIRLEATTIPNAFRPSKPACSARKPTLSERAQTHRARTGSGMTLRRQIGSRTHGLPCTPTPPQSRPRSTLAAGHERGKQQFANSLALLEKSDDGVNPRCT